MSSFLRRVFNRDPIQIVRRRRSTRQQLRIVAVLVIVCLLIASLPSNSGSTHGSSLLGNTSNRQHSFAFQIYRSVTERLASFGNWVASHLRSESHGNNGSSYQPVVAYFNAVSPFIDAPTNLNVTGVQANTVSLSWTPSTGSVDHYTVERTTNITTQFQFLTNVSSAATIYNDNSVSNLHSYLYRVRAVSSTGAFSVPSNVAMGTARTFEFANLQGQEIRKQHFYDVRTAINAVRSVANLLPVSWAPRTDLTGLEVKTDDVQQMRTALDAGLTALGIPVLAYEEATLTSDMFVRAIHLEQLQTRSTRGSSNSSGSLESDSSTARLDPMNETGGGRENPLSRNFNWNLPVLSLPGRAGMMDLSLTLSYNSLVWTKIGSNSIAFDDDNSFPGPGFRLGFPVIQPLYSSPQTSKGAFLLVSPDGSRTELRQVGSLPLYESADSSHLLLDSTTMILRTTDGTQLSYALQAGEYKCTQIKDRNGNYITIGYTIAGQINTITDTLGRIVTFNYDGSGWLTSITQQWNSSPAPPHYWARFTYTDQTVHINFPGKTVYGPQENNQIKTLTQVKLADDSHFDFSYTSWGQAYKVSAYAPDNHLLNYRFYNLPQTAGAGLEHDDCPRFTERRDWAQYWNGDTDGIPTGSEEALTQFAIPASASWTMPGATSTVDGMRTQVTAPDGTSNKIYFLGTFGWQRGLVALMDTYSSGGSVPVRRSMTTWTQDAPEASYPVNPRVTETDIYDDASNRARTEVTYQQFDLGSGMSCHLPRDSYQYAVDGTTVLRSTRTAYNMDASYVSRRILGLVNDKFLYEGDVNTNGVLMSKLAFFYDQSGAIQGNEAPVQHDNTNYTASFVVGRGNLSSAKRYDVTNTNVFTTTSSKFNTAGSVVLSTDAANHTVTINYTDSFSDGVSRNTLAYPTKITDPDNFFSTSKYDFNFGAVTRRQTPRPNTTDPNDANPRPEQSWTFDSIGRLQQVTNLVNSSYTRFEYSTSQIQVDTYATIQEGLGEAHSFKLTDGVGRVIATASDHNTNTFSGQRMVYDVMGRIIKTSNPTETSAGGSPLQWNTTGDDQNTGWIYTEQTYDWKGRPLVTTNPSLTGNAAETTTKQFSYSGCGCAGGQIVILKDEGTIVNGVTKRRKQKVYSDVFGRLMKTELFEWEDGVIYSTTVHAYNALDQVTKITEFAGAEDSTSYQETNMTYDGFGRLKTSSAPDQQVDSYNSASTNHITYFYNTDDTLSQQVDARGVVKTFTYNNRRMVTAISYDVGNIPPNYHQVAATANLSFSYDAVGNRLSMSDGTGTISNQYNILGRLTAETRQFSGALSGTNYTSNYEYNLGGEVKKITDHTNTTINYNYNRVGQLTTVTGENNLVESISTYASGFEYRAWGAVSDVAFGNGTTQNISFNSRMLPTSSSIGNVIVGLNQNATMSWTYDYYSDARLRHASDGSDNRFDQMLDFDHAARMKEAYSGREARGLTATNPADSPYRQSFQYNAFSDLTLKNGRFWRTEQSGATPCVPRHTDDGCDAEGNVLNYLNDVHIFDAAGKQTSYKNWRTTVGGTPNHLEVLPGIEITQTYDGDGKAAKRIETRRSEELINGGPNTNISETITTSYFIYSSVMGGARVVELDVSGNKVKGYVYANGARLAKQIIEPTFSAVTWHHPNPGTNSWIETGSDRGPRREEMDPDGAEVGTDDPWTNVVAEGPPSYGKLKDDEPLYQEGGDPFDYVSGYTLDGMPMTRSLLNRILGKLGGSTMLLFDVMRGVPVSDTTNRAWVWPIGTISIDLQQKKKPSWKDLRIPQIQLPQTIPVGDLKALLQERLSFSDCAEYITKLLNKVAELNPSNPLGSTDILSLYDQITLPPNGGFVISRNLVVVDPETGRRYPVAGYTDGSLVNGNARVHISFVESYGAPNNFNLRHAAITYGLTALHEIIHQAGGKGYYTDYQLAVAAKALNQEAEWSPLTGGGIDSVLKNSGYWDSELKKHCVPASNR